MDKRVKKLVSDLEERDERKVIGALKRIPHEGSPDVIIPMLRLLAKSPSSEVQMLLQKTLFNLKDQACSDKFIDALEMDELAPIRTEILTCVWQSGLDVSESLDLLIDISIKDDYMVAVEVLTIIDNTEHFPEHLLSDSIHKLDKVLEVKSEKTGLYGNLRQVLLEKLLD